MLKQNKKAPKSRMNRKLWLGLVVIVIVAGVVFGVTRSRSSQDSTATTPSVPTVAPNTINDSPPTAAEKAAGNAQKEKDVQQMQEDAAGSTPTTTTKSVTPTITSISQSGTKVTVGAFVSGVFEDGGTCTVTATQGSAKVTGTSAAFANATTTSCAPFNLAASSFTPSGNWTFTVAYSSPTASGTSSSQVFGVK